MSGHHTLTLSETELAAVCFGLACLRSLECGSPLGNVAWIVLGRARRNLSDATVVNLSRTTQAVLSAMSPEAVEKSRVKR